MFRLDSKINKNCNCELIERTIDDKIVWIENGNKCKEIKQLKQLHKCICGSFSIKLDRLSNDPGFERYIFDLYLKLFCCNLEHRWHLHEYLGCLSHEHVFPCFCKHIYKLYKIRFNCSYCVFYNRN